MNLLYCLETIIFNLSFDARTITQVIELEQCSFYLQMT